MSDAPGPRWITGIHCGCRGDRRAGLDDLAALKEGHSLLLFGRPRAASMMLGRLSKIRFRKRRPASQGAERNCDGATSSFSPCIELLISYVSDGPSSL
jgi:hypothetical protein